MRSVARVADELDVSGRRVRQLLERGDLRGSHVGRIWVIDDEALREFKARSRGQGRPWKALSAWAVLAEASGTELSLSPVERSRARQRLRQRSWPELLGGLRDRASVQKFYAHPAALDRLRRDDALVLAGVSAAPFVGVDLVGLDGEVDAYVDARDLSEVVKRFVLDAHSDRPNVVLRVVDHDCWPFANHQHIVPKLVVGVDMAEHGDSRVRRAGLEILDST